MTAGLGERFHLPDDHFAGCLIGRAWTPGSLAGPAVVAIRQDGVFDISEQSATTSELFDRPDPAAHARTCPGVRLGDLDALVGNSDPLHRDPLRPWLLAPVDLQAVKAAGVTFAASLLERVVEEQAQGDPSRASDIRDALSKEIGANLSRVKPGSLDAERLKVALRERGLWSQYLEVGIGPDPEIFTKAQPMSAVGFGADIGLHPASVWNNPEPEIVAVVSSAGKIVGATLGNDVNLRDFEGRSALLLGKAKDNNASTAIGPFVRLFDETFGLDDVRQAEVDLRIDDAAGYVLTGSSSMSRISRDIPDLVEAAMGGYHQYPDGMVLFLGTMFAPTQDRDKPGEGFTHKPGDIVVVSSDRLGALANRVTTSDRAEPWTFGARALMNNLAARGLLPTRRATEPLS